MTITTFHCKNNIFCLIVKIISNLLPVLVGAMLINQLTSLMIVTQLQV